MIVFDASVQLREGTNLRIVPGGLRLSPNLQFDLPGLANERFGLAVMEPEFELVSGETGPATFRLIGVPEFRALARDLSVGTKFTLQQGPIIVGFGTVKNVADRSIDDSGT